MLVSLQHWIDELIPLYVYENPYLGCPDMDLR